ncbi:DUF7123 family protein [Halomarina litorea]|uniref:DUF7123 family protein n=1 Tax=Halomarina litorea TaxID=2961595 RepID=UPI0020C3E7D0|nr:hypothetical protein [Halomarina sp. BCD28]
MSTTTTHTEKQQRILSYLREHAQTRSYFKSRQIGEALGLSPKEVGANITAVLANGGETDLAIEKWGYSSSTTWKVTLSMN